MTDIVTAEMVDINIDPRHVRKYFILIMMGELSLVKQMESIYPNIQWTLRSL